METVIVSAVRTPFGSFGGSLKDISATSLGALVIKEAVARAGISANCVDNVIMGMVLQAGAGQIPSRQASVRAGLPFEVTSEIINKVCASGLRSVTLADQMIRAGDVEIVVAGGMESMSNAPFGLKKARWGYRMGNDEIIDLMVHDGLWCAFHNVHMAVHGSTIAKQYRISREEQDEFAYCSQIQARAAILAGKFRDEIIDVPIPQKKEGLKIFDTDESPRMNTTREGLAALPAIFDRNGTITAGNAPSVNDGAAAMVVMSANKASAMGIKPLATILGHTTVAAEPSLIATVPGLAINKLLAKKGLNIGQINLIEVNEAFAVVPLVSGRVSGWDDSKVNVNGGAIALGHPLGASGSRIIATLIFELCRRGGGIGIASICSGAAQGDAILIRVE